MPLTNDSRAPIISYASVRGGNRPATLALVWGLLNFIPFLPGVLAIRYGRQGLRVAESAGAGRGKARAGVILGVLNLCWSVAFALSLYPAYQKSQRAREAIQCASQLRQIGQACMMYASANNGWTPPNLGILTSGGFLPTQFVCPGAVHNGVSPGTYTLALPATRLSAIGNAGNTVLAYEPASHHWGGAVNILFADGHVEFCMPARAAAILPKPVPPIKPATLPAEAPPR